MQINYMYTFTSNDSIEIEDVGNFNLSISNDMYSEWIMICSTLYGITTCFQAGPFIPDFDNITDKVTYSFQRFEYNQNKIYKMIDNFINDSKKLITRAEIIDKDEAKIRIKDLTKYI